MDFHTHSLSTPPGAGIVCLPQEALLSLHDWLDDSGHLPHAAEGALYAAGIHPWWVAQPDFDLMRHLEALSHLLPLPEVVQLGECGLDKVQGDSADRAPAPIERQEGVFRRQIALSLCFDKPMTIHCVRAFDRLLRLRKLFPAAPKWTVHGFRGKPALARQLLATGFDLSFGPLRNAESYALTPSGRRHDETDGF